MEILAKWCCMSWAGQREFDEFAARRSDETPTSADFVDRIDAEPATWPRKISWRHYSFRLRCPPLKMPTI
jgi:hypothetical protein